MTNQIEQIQSAVGSNNKYEKQNGNIFVSALTSSRAIQYTCEFLQCFFNNGQLYRSNQRLYFIYQPMNCQDSQPHFRFFRIKNTLKRGFIKQSMVIRIKYKPICKKNELKCQNHCMNHRFSLKKIASNCFDQLSKDINDVTLSFCPQVDEIVQSMHGGFPSFTNDQRVDTPCFAPKFDVNVNLIQNFSDLDDEMYRSRYERMKKNAQAIFQEQKEKQYTHEINKSQHQKRTYSQQASFQMHIEDLDIIILNKK